MRTVLLMFDWALQRQLKLPMALRGPAQASKLSALAEAPSLHSPPADGPSAAHGLGFPAGTLQNY